MLIRVRSNVGVWRVDGLDDSGATVSDIVEGIRGVRPHVKYEKELSFDPGCKDALDKSKTLLEQNLKHGSMVYCKVDASTTAEDTTATTAAAAATSTAGGGGQASSSATNANMKRIIDKDGNVKLIPSNEIRNDKDDRGFRKGMLPLRDIKMQWTLNDFMALDSQFTFKIKRQENPVCQQVSLDTPSIHDFQSYVQRFDFARTRVGYLYGKFITDEDGKKDDDTNKKQKTEKEGEDATKKQPTKTIVEAIYEPPQDIDHDAAEGFVLLDDPMEETVEQIAEMLGLTKVGWIFAHPPGREEDTTNEDEDRLSVEEPHKPYVLSNAEIIMAAELQLEAAEGIHETPFVTVKVTKGNDGHTTVEAFQVSQQCMEMAAEEALEIGPHTQPNVITINEKFSAIQEGKESKEIDNNFFITVVPIIQHTSDVFLSQFPKCNRDLDDRIQSHDELKKQLSKSGTAGWTFLELLADFNLLIYLSKFLDVNADLPKISQSIIHRDTIPLDDGYKIIISSLAGLDGSY